MLNCVMTAINMAVYMSERRKNRRNQLIEMSGGRCVKRGSTDDLNFDHKDPKERTFRLTGDALDKAWKKVLEEWGKCQLLCRKCHHRKTKENDEYGEPWNRGISKSGEVLPEHGCEAAYMRGCRCEACCKARHGVRVSRGELKGVRGFRGPNQSDNIDHGTRRGYQKEKRLGVACLRGMS